MTGFPVVVRVLPVGTAAELRLTVERFSGSLRFDLRTWADYRLGASEVRGPTKKGVSLPVEALPDLVAAVVEAEAEARALGLLEEGGGKTE